MLATKASLLVHWALNARQVIWRLRWISNGAARVHSCRGLCAVTPVGYEIVFSRHAQLI
jgi:hypothetical protein